MEYKVQIKRLEFWLRVRPQCSYRMNNLSTCNIVCAAEGDNFPLVLLNKWRSFPGPQMLLSECRSRLIRTLTVVILTNMTDKCYLQRFWLPFTRWLETNGKLKPWFKLYDLFSKAGEVGVLLACCELNRLWKRKYGNGKSWVWY